MPAHRGDKELFLKDWEIAKDRIRHFDEIVVTIRIQGIPIATAIIVAGFIAYPYIKTISINVGWFAFSAVSLVFLSSALFLIPISLLDWLHYDLLLKSVKHAWQIEERREFKGRLRITHALTSNKLTNAHTIAAATIYLSIMVVAIILSYIFR